MNLQDLNRPQQQAVKCIDRPCLVLAGAGSGKTGVITRKIGWLIDQGYAPGQVYAVTFTNKAAREMKSRVNKLHAGNLRGLKISTFHSLGQRILQQEASQLGYRRGFSILDARDTEDCLRELARRQLDDNEFARQTRYRISHWKNEFIDAEAALAAAGDEFEAIQARLYQDYEQHLQACNSMDFDDLIKLPVTLFHRDPAALNRWQDKIRYLLIDEYQDTNTSQYEFIKQLCGMRQKLTVVGDDDQSIYAWRGARPENLVRLQQDFPALKVIRLEQNYRSSRRILAAANQLIDNNHHIYPKRLWTSAGAGEKIRVLPCKNADDEANRIAVDILSRRFQEQVTSNFGILYRSNFQSRQYEKALRDLSIPYQVTGGLAFFERREIKDLMAYLRLLVNPNDDQALLRIINVPRREIGATTIKTLAQYAAQRHHGLDRAMRELGLLETLGHRARIRVSAFTDLVDELRGTAETTDAMSLCQKLIAAIDYRPWLDETCTSVKQADTAGENVTELISWIGKLQIDQQDQTLQAIMPQLSLMSILDSDRDDPSAELVQLTTIHAAKGLEFDHVYLAGFEEDSLPHHQSQDTDGVEEERRLVYVAMTRARYSLAFSYAKTRQKFGELLQCEPSRFLLELPAADLEGAEHTASSLSDAERHQRGLDTLADLKAMLGTSD